MTEKQIIDLETKIAFQEMALEELHNTVYGQQAEIAKLEKSLKLLTERFQAALGASVMGPAHEKPPHY